jgi:hypothetical protein
MARRASSATNPVWFIVAALLVVAAIAVGWFLKNRVSDPFRTLPAFPVSEYMENANSLRGNTYKLDGIISDQLGYQQSNRVFSVKVNGQPIPVVVPSQFNFLDLRKDGHFQFKVEVAEKGILKAQDVRKE